MTKKIEVSFITPNLKSEYEELKEGKFEDKQLHKFITRARNDLKNNPFSGIRVPKKLWPEVYIKKYRITNLWKYDLPNGWRLTYIIEASEVKIVSIILEWFSHKEYEKRFKY